MCQGLPPDIGFGHPTFNREPLYRVYEPRLLGDDYPLLYGNSESSIYGFAGSFFGRGGVIFFFNIQ